MARATVAAAPDRGDRRRFRRISLDLAAQPADLVIDGVVTQPDQKGAVEVWRHVADQLRPRWPKLTTLMDETETDVLAYMAFPAQQRTKLYRTRAGCGHSDSGFPCGLICDSLCLWQMLGVIDGQATSY